MNDITLKCLSETPVEADWFIENCRDRQTIEYILKSAWCTSTYVLVHRICAYTNKSMQ